MTLISDTLDLISANNFDFSGLPAYSSINGMTGLRHLKSHRKASSGFGLKLSAAHDFDSEFQSHSYLYQKIVRLAIYEAQDVFGISGPQEITPSNINNWLTFIDFLLDRSPLFALRYLKLPDWPTDNQSAEVYVQAYLASVIDNHAVGVPSYWSDDYDTTPNKLRITLHQIAGDNANVRFKIMYVPNHITDSTHLIQTELTLQDAQMYAEYLTSKIPTYVNDRISDVLSFIHNSNTQLIEVPTSYQKEFEESRLTVKDVGHKLMTLKDILRHLHLLMNHNLKKHLKNVRRHNRLRIIPRHGGNEILAALMEAESAMMKEQKLENRLQTNPLALALKEL